jgi:GMP reductase
VAKAFAGGADFVMLGGMLAGHDEGGGNIITKHYKTNELEYEVGEHLDNQKCKIEEKKFVQFYGMSSDAANTKHFGGLKDYRASEGREVLVPYRGEVQYTVQAILGGLRSTCTYAGASRLKHLMRCATFVMVNNQFNRTYESTTTKL